MNRDIEKDLIEIESAIKSNRERDNIFTLSVLQRCHKLVSELKEYKDLEEQGKLLKLPCQVGHVCISKGERQIIEMKVGCIELYGTVRSYKGVLTKYDSDTGKESQDNDDVLALFLMVQSSIVLNGKEGAV